MRLIYPKAITLDSSTIAANSDGYSEWSSGTTYAIGNMVMVTTVEPHKIYESLADSNTNNPPAATPLKWQDQGGTNRWKMFDGFLDTQSSAATSIEVEINASNCDRLMLFNLDALQVDVELTDETAAAVVYTETYDLSLTSGLYKQSLIERIPIIANATLKITIGYASGTAKCGYCAAGWSTYIGLTRWGVTPTIVDYSVKATDGFGYTYLSQGAFANNIDVDVLIDYGDIDNVFEDLTSARGTIVGIEANESGTDYQSLRGLGFPRYWKIGIDNPVKNICRIEFQGVI